jgi:hypothetical protein
MQSNSARRMATHGYRTPSTACGSTHISYQAMPDLYQPLPDLYQAMPSGIAQALNSESRLQALGMQISSSSAACPSRTAFLPKTPRLQLLTAGAPLA